MWEVLPARFNRRTLGLAICGEGLQHRTFLDSGPVASVRLPGSKPRSCGSRGGGGADRGSSAAGGQSSFLRFRGTTRMQFSILSLKSNSVSCWNQHRAVLRGFCGYCPCPGCSRRPREGGTLRPRAAAPGAGRAARPSGPHGQCSPSSRRVGGRARAHCGPGSRSRSAGETSAQAPVGSARGECAGASRERAASAQAPAGSAHACAAPGGAGPRGACALGGAGWGGRQLTEAAQTSGERPLASRAPARGSPVHVSSRWTRRGPGQRHGHHRQHAARAGEAAGGSAAGSGAPGEARRRAADERGGGRRVEAAPAGAGRGWWSPAARMVPSRARSRVGARAPDGALPARLRPGGATSHIPAPRFARDGVRAKRGRGGVARAGRFSCPARSVGGTRTAQPCRAGEEALRLDPPRDRKAPPRPSP